MKLAAFLWLTVLSVLFLSAGPAVRAQVAVSPDAKQLGTYSSAVPSTHFNDDGYYRPTPSYLFNLYDSHLLHASPDILAHAPPTNQWYSDLIYSLNSSSSQGTFQSRLYAFPGIVRPAATSVDINYPKSFSGGWGKSLAPNASVNFGWTLTLNWQGMAAATSTPPVVTSFGDWSVTYHQADAAAHTVDTTLARGVPFVWTQLGGGISPVTHLPSRTTLYGSDGTVLGVANGGTSGQFTASSVAFDVADGNGDLHSFGLYAPIGSRFSYSGDTLQIVSPAYVVVGLLPAHGALAEYAAYAYNRPISTRMDWAAAYATGAVNTTWTVGTLSLLDGTTGGPTLQGWLPHHLRTTAYSMALLPADHNYLTARGAMRLAAGRQWTIAFPFRGLTPALPAPTDAAYSPSRMTTYVSQFAAQHPGTVGDTYFGGKELAISAYNLSMAAQLAQAGPFQKMDAGLWSQFTDWFTYTPGKADHFFARLASPTSGADYGALIGFTPTFGTQGFNDNHFHYGYWAFSSALLGMHDAAFLNQYGALVTDVVKDYANWDRADTTYPFLRTFDIWEGHSWAGGLSSANGENQESSSEAVNSWVGEFMLGNMLGNQGMADCGAMGYAMETAADNEYYFDAAGTNFPDVYTGPAQAKIPRMEVGTILGASSIAYQNYFDWDPAINNGIEWLPSGQWDYYLARNPTQAATEYADLYLERQAFQDAQVTIGSATPYHYTPQANDIFGLFVWGSEWATTAVGFQALFDPANAVSELDKQWTSNNNAVTDGAWESRIYYLSHSFNSLGEEDETWYADMPTSQVFKNPTTGVHTVVVFNPQLTAQVVKVYSTGGGYQGSLLVPARRLVTTSSLNSGAVTPSPYYGFAAPVPGTIRCVNYDFGGEGVGDHDADGVNAGSVYRPNEGVDIRAASGAANGYAVGPTAPGQWLSYTISVPRTGAYTCRIRAASPSGGALHFTDENGLALTGTVTLPATGSATAFTTVTVSITLAAGSHRLVLVEDSAGDSLDILTFYATGAAANIPLGQTISMQSLANGKYICSDLNVSASAPLNANRGSASTWEEFKVIDAGTGIVALQALQAAPNVRYVAVGTGNALISTATSITGAEKFQWYDLGSGQFALASVANGQIVTVVNPTNTSQALLYAQQATIGTNETFVYQTIAPAITTVSGSVSLQGTASGGMAQALTFTLTPMGSTTGSVTTQTLTPAADGSFTLANVPAGTYTLGVKGARWLRKDLALDTTSGNVSGLSVSLLGGDLNGDNAVDINDFNVLRSQFNQTGTGLAADINGDGVVDINDFSILRANFNKIGDS